MIKYDAVLAAAAHSAIPAIVETALKQAREVTEDMIQALYKSQHRPSNDALPALSDKREMEMEMEKNMEKGTGEAKERDAERDKERDKDDARSVCSIKTTNMLNVSGHPYCFIASTIFCVSIILIFKTAHLLKSIYFMRSLLSSLFYRTLTLLSYPIQSYPILSYLALSYPILSYPILSNPILSYPILPYPIQSYLLQSYPILSCPILSNPILPYPIQSYPILSYPILSYPILS